MEVTHGGNFHEFTGGQGPVTRAEIPAGVSTLAIFSKKTGSEERFTSAKARIPNCVSR